MDFLKSSSIIALLFMVLCAQTTLAQSDAAIINAFKQSYSHEAKADYTKAIESLKKVYKDGSYELNLRLGWLTYLSGLFTDAEAYYQKCVTLLPYSIEAKLGLVYPTAAQGKWEMVIKQYNKILAIDPKNSTANYRLGLIYYGRKEYKKAYTYFDKNVNLYPFSYNGLIMFAWCNLQTGKLREAKILFNKVLMLSPDDKSALEGLGMIK